MASPSPEPVSGVEKSSLLSALRRHTAHAHEALDRGSPLQRGHVTRAGYAAFLRGSHLVLRALEPALLAHPELPLSPATISREVALRADLAALGEEPPPGLVDLPILHSAAAAWGAAYVVEGSALGGTVLSARVAEALGEAAPLQFLRLRGEGTGAAWRTFLTKLAAREGKLDEAERKEACTAAVGVFEAYAQAFRRTGALPHDLARDLARELGTESKLRA